MQRRARKNAANCRACLINKTKSCARWLSSAKCISLDRDIFLCRFAAKLVYFAAREAATCKRLCHFLLSTCFDHSGLKSPEANLRLIARPTNRVKVRRGGAIKLQLPLTPRGRLLESPSPAQSRQLREQSEFTGKLAGRLRTFAYSDLLAPSATNVSRIDKPVGSHSKVARCRLPRGERKEKKIVSREQASIVIPAAFPF